MRVLPLWVGVALGLAACQTGNGSGYNDDPHEGYVDPGPNEIANALVREADRATDAEGQPVALRVDGFWADDGLWYVLQDGDAWVSVAEIEFGRSGYPMTLYRMPDGVSLPFDAAAFDDLTPDDLELAEGCTVRFERTAPFEYAGQTEGTTCASSRDDTAYETLELVIGDSLVWSRRGFGADSTQLWGPPLMPAREP
ncbi:MAG: hypothetical protein Rubg2KO_00100 [Rubricoccaceae bacterium]